MNEDIYDIVDQTISDHTSSPQTLFLDQHPHHHTSLNSHNTSLSSHITSLSHQVSVNPHYTDLNPPITDLSHHNTLQNFYSTYSPRHSSHPHSDLGSSTHQTLPRILVSSNACRPVFREGLPSPNKKEDSLASHKSNTLSIITSSNGLLTASTTSKETFIRSKFCNSLSSLPTQDTSNVHNTLSFYDDSKLRNEIKINDSIQLDLYSNEEFTRKNYKKIKNKISKKSFEGQGSVVTNPNVREDIIKDNSFKNNSKDFRKKVKHENINNYNTTEFPSSKNLVAKITFGAFRIES